MFKHWVEQVQRQGYLEVILKRKNNFKAHVRTYLQDCMVVLTVTSKIVP